MEYVLIIHEVDDYAKWESGFDDAAQLRKDAGELDFQVLQYEYEPTKVVHFSRWKSLERAKKFFESEEVQEIRKTLGVASPEFIYLKERQAGTL